jgi:hypothetical protein
MGAAGAEDIACEDAADLDIVVVADGPPLCC